MQLTMVPHTFKISTIRAHVDRKSVCEDHLFPGLYPCSLHFENEKSKEERFTYRSHQPSVISHL